MIPRYEKKEISSIWSEDKKFHYFLMAELAILKSQEGLRVPVGTSDKIREIAKINPQRIDEIEKVTKHDVIAFCTSITEQLDPKVSKFFHFGVTSSDIIDTATNLQIKASLEVIIPSVEKLLTALEKISIDNKSIIAMGRSHGMTAEPLSFGQKFLSFYCEIYRRYNELKDYLKNDITGQFSGAVGNYTILPNDSEKIACEQLNLIPEPISTQVIPRDRIAKLISINSLLASAIERVAVEIRHLHRSEVAEVFEGFSKGQKGSSIMPHKKNPISGENLTGIARMIRSHQNIALENIVLWHERDISHSSAERMFLPDNLGLVKYATDRLCSTIENLVVKTETIENRVKNERSYLSSFYLHFLIEKTSLTREEIYEVVQSAAFNYQESDIKNLDDRHKVYTETISKLLTSKGINESVPVVNFEKIKELYLKKVDTIFDRVFRVYPKLK